MFRITTDSPMFAISVPNKTFNSFVRALDTMRYAVQRRAREYGYGLKENLAYEMENHHFAVDFIDDFGFIHTFYVVEVEDAQSSILLSSC